ncbi:hypothetical protein H3N56_08875 [Cetobacterium sp. 2A]|uniref:hypothetical protein n=1 Tax=Cetobacterium sp. 2A TaxID=2754723 RepID=UPI00163D3CA3|nr:hypothetical protein [Cetobacterium sp. 2A]MBC2856557.1 hypothetical protein [Cetobacterium sp. 2A]
MGYQKSYSGVFNKYWDTYRQKVSESQSASQAESIQNVKDIFTQTVVKMLLEINPNLNINQNDIVYVSSEVVDGMTDKSDDVKNRLENDENYPKHYKISDKLLGEPEFVKMIEESDLISCFDKFAEITTNRIVHISKEHGHEKANGKRIIH